MKKREIQIALPATGEDEWLSLKDSIMSGWLTQGPKVKQFEKKFSEKFEIKHSLAVSSCTSGLHIALVAMGVGLEMRLLFQRLPGFLLPMLCCIVVPLLFLSMFLLILLI